MKLSKYGFDYIDDPSLYIFIVDAFQYVIITRFYIGYNVNKVYQFMSQPLLKHWKEVTRTLHYLKGTISYGLHLQPALSSDKYSLITIYCFQH